MSKYIKLEDALEQAKRGTNNYYICKAIESLPTYEVADLSDEAYEVGYTAGQMAERKRIVRCKDCKHGEYRGDFDNYLCDQLGLGSVNDADFFCSYGERTEE